MAQLEIDGRAVEVPDGSTIMDAAHQLGIYVPHFCYHEKLSIAANCRMCLVQVEKAPKPLPACATPVAPGMKVWTHSTEAVTAQKGVMEFLLINHPLDCPICDQGGECALQDLAVGYGDDASRYGEAKRVVSNKDLGALIATDMTRCIQCTRCVRFGQEIAGVMELGMVGRGEHSEIATFVGKAVTSELSGNIIDLCPVGALTSKPFRFSARAWELTQRTTISPHDGLGSNLTAQVKQNRVMRVVPRDNEAINECWLSDKDRFSYEGLNAADRLPRPLIKRDGAWVESDWQTALEFVAQGLKQVSREHGNAHIGWLATPHQTLEELYLLGKLARHLGGNVDFRLRQSDFSADGKRAGIPHLGMALADLHTLDRALIIGSALRQDHPLIAQRLRAAARQQLQVNVLNPVDDDWLMRIAHRAIVAPAQLVATLAQITKAVAALKQATLQPALQNLVAGVQVDARAQRIAESLASGANAGIFLGNLAEHHPHAAQLQRWAQALAEVLHAKFGFLGEAANSVGGYLAGAVPALPGASGASQRGLNAAQMFAQPRKAYVLLGAEPALDAHDGAQAAAALAQAEFVVALSPYQHGLEYAHAILPVAPFSETAGTFVNTEGRAQSFSAVVRPLAETRPAWKVLRVLGNLLDVAGFDYETIEAVRAEALPNDIASRLNNALQDDFNAGIGDAQHTQAGIFERIGEIPAYQADAIVRRAPALQHTPAGAAPVAAVNAGMFAQLGLRAGDQLRITSQPAQNAGSAVLDVVVDDGLPDHCVRVPAAHRATAMLGALFGRVTLERVAIAQKQKVSA